MNSANITQNGLSPITTCKHCNERFDGGVAIIGQPSKRMQDLLMKLGSHMNTKHPDHARSLDIYGAAFMGFMFLLNFKTTDEELGLHRDRLRWQIHQQTLNARFSDESLREQCKRLAASVLKVVYDEHFDADVDLPRVLYEAMSSVRDALEEPNRYAVEKQGQLVS